MMDGSSFARAKARLAASISQRGIIQPIPTANFDLLIADARIEAEEARLHAQIAKSQETTK